jgi:hypothetical protein
MYGRRVDRARLGNIVIDAKTIGAKGTLKQYSGVAHDHHDISGRSFAVVHNRTRLIWSGGPFPVGSTAGRKSSDH